MRNFILVLCLCFVIPQVFAYSTQASKFAEKQYGMLNNYKTHINSKKEHTFEYQQMIGKTFVPAITYGWGDMKIKGSKKCRISYIVILDKNCKPVWSSIYPSKQ